MERSCCVCMCVGDVALGVDPSMIFFVDHCLLRPPPDWPPAVDGVGTGGDMLFSYCDCGPLGSGCWTSLANLRAGNMSSRSLLKSSVSLRRSCSKSTIRSSRRRNCSTRCLISFIVAFADCASVSAAAVQSVSEAHSDVNKFRRNTYSTACNDRFPRARLAPF